MMVEELKDGNTVGKIFDDSCKDKTEDEINKILQAIAERALEHFNRQKEIA